MMQSTGKQPTQHNLCIEVVHQALYKLGLNGGLVGEHAEEVGEVGVLRDDDTLPPVLKLGPPSSAKDLLHIQQACPFPQAAGEVARERLRRDVCMTVHEGCWIMIDLGSLSRASGSLKKTEDI